MSFFIHLGPLKQEFNLIAQMKIEIVIGKALRRVREKREKSQREVRLDTDVNVCNYESSFRMPRADIFIRLMMYYELKYDVFISMLLEAVNSNRSIERMVDERWADLAA